MSKKLYSLIRSLSPNEKSHFKKVSAMHIIRGQNVYMKLFDLIDKMDEYDSSSLQSHFQDREGIDKIAPYSNYLFGKILDSLRIYNAGSTIDSEIRYLLLDVESLAKKSMFTEAGSILTKAKRKAIKFERTYFSIEIINWEDKLARIGSNRQSLDEVISTKHNERMKAIATLKNSIQYEWLHSMVVSHLTDTGEHLRSEKDFKKLDGIMSHPLLLSEKRAVTWSDKYLYSFNHELYNYFKRKREIKKCIEFCLKRKELMEKNIVFASDQMNPYLSIFDNLFTFYLEMFDLANMDRVIEDVRAIPTRFKRVIQERDEIFRISYLNSFFLTRCFVAGKYEDALNTVKGKEAYWKGIYFKTGDRFVKLFYEKLRSLSFADQDLKKALFWNNRILNDESRIQAHYISALLWEIIIHYNLGNFELVEKRVASLELQLRDQVESLKFEQLFLRNIKKILKANYDSNAAVKECFNIFKTDLADFQARTAEMEQITYITYMAWIDSAIENRKFSEAIKKYMKAVHR